MYCTLRKKSDGDFDILTFTFRLKQYGITAEYENDHLICKNGIRFRVMSTSGFELYYINSDTKKQGDEQSTHL